jgi:hypothetical protein
MSAAIALFGFLVGFSAGLIFVIITHQAPGSSIAYFLPIVFAGFFSIVGLFTAERLFPVLFVLLLVVDGGAYIWHHFVR